MIMRAFQLIPRNTVVTERHRVGWQGVSTRFISLHVVQVSPATDQKSTISVLSQQL